jgi:hypothetical protein
VLCGALADSFGADVPLIVIAGGLTLLAVANHLVPAVRQLDSMNEDGDAVETRVDPEERITR